MKHQFTIVKHVKCSRANVIANYLDLEHMPAHSGLMACRVMSEADRAACFEITSKVGPFKIRNVHYYEFRPPNQIFHAVESPLGPMYVLYTVLEFHSGTDDVRSEVTVETTLDMPRLLFPMRGLIERLLRRLNVTVHREDCAILERRQKLFGAGVSDYLRDEQCLLFKDLFRASVGGGGTGPT
jgi:hypothetical protein